jgi:predicted RNase H-like HicB family nuclease
MNNLTLLDEVVIPETIDYLEEDRIYQVSCLWLPGAHAWGESLDEALQAIPDNIRAMVEAYREKGSALPTQLGIAKE